MTETYRCPTPCDGDCELNGWGCHEAHDEPKRREHDAGSCEARTLSGNLRWLLDDGWLAELGRADPPRWDVAYWVSVRRPGDRVSVHFSGVSPGEAVWKARAAREAVTAGARGVAQDEGGDALWPPRALTATTGKPHGPSLARSGHGSPASRTLQR